MKYFMLCDKGQAATMYKELAKLHHPAKGGNVATWLEITAEYQSLNFDEKPAPAPKPDPKPAPAPAPAPAPKAEPAPAPKEKVISAELQAAIDFAKTLPDVTVELAGFWLWVTGETRKNAPLLKANGFEFASKKEAWFFRSDSHKVFKKRGGKTLDLTEIKDKYGAKEIF